MSTPDFHYQTSKFTSGYGYQAAHEYTCSPVQTQAPFSAVGYPYVPHNPTLPELEACESRMRSVKNRQATYSCSSTYRASDAGSCGWAETASTAGSNEPDDILHHVGSYGPTSVDPHSSEEDEESDGPETPFSSQKFLWQEWAAGAPSVQGPQTYDGNTFETLASTAAHNKVKQIVYKFNLLVLGFKFPANLEFAASTDTEEHLPELAHTSASKVIWEYNHKLEKLLEELDEIQPLGHSGVKRARKLAIDRLIKELEEVKEKQAMAWYNRQYECGACKM